MAGIVGYGAYVPMQRLDRQAIAAAHRWVAPALGGLAKGTRAIANWDEDALTMAVEAARGCIAEGDPAPEAIHLGSTSLPFVDRQNAGIVKEALALPDAMLTADLTGSQRAGVTALLTGLRSIGDRPILCIGSERQRPQPGSEMEIMAADGAAALLLGREGAIAELVDSHVLSTDFVDHFQAAGASFAYGWESRWVRDEGYDKIVPNAVAPLLERNGLSGADIAHFAFGSPARGIAARLARKLGLADGAVDERLSALIGHAGSAQPLLALVHALEKARPGEWVLLASFGQGCDAALFRVTEAITGYRSRRPLSAALERKRSTSDYLRYLALADLLPLDRGMRAEQDQKTPLTALYRERKAVLGLIGGRSPATGAVQYPRSDIGLDDNPAQPTAMEDYRLADRAAHVLTFTADRLAYAPAPPYFYGMIAFEGGGRMAVDFTDCAEGELAVGTSVTMMFRIKAQDELRNFTRYFWKAVPASGA
jgi:3-hydroxy-3-methylglutaryl CoA synthase